MHYYYYSEFIVGEMSSISIIDHDCDLHTSGGGQHKQKHRQQQEGLKSNTIYCVGVPQKNHFWSPPRTHVTNKL